MTRFLLIRHAITNAVGQRLSGRMPGIHLNEDGKLQAQALAERLQGLLISAVYCSPLERALETADPLARMLNLQPVISEDFTEINFGEWTNSAFREIEDHPHFKRFNTFRSNTRIPGGELMAEAQLRIVKGLEKLGASFPGKTVAVISHADLIKAAIAYYAGVHLDMFQRIEINPASVSILYIYDDTARIILVNHTGEVKF